jgi:hypothetical protein
MFEELIQETEKGCDKHKQGHVCLACVTKERSFYYCLCGTKCFHCKNIILCDLCQVKLETLKQCQTIAEEREKEIIERIQSWVELSQWTTNQGSQVIAYTSIRDYLKMLQLNPAQTEE